MLHANFLEKNLMLRLGKAGFPMLDCCYVFPQKKIENKQQGETGAAPFLAHEEIETPKTSTLLQIKPPPFRESQQLRTSSSPRSTHSIE